jgi:hypothetical protein
MTRGGWFDRSGEPSSPFAFPWLADGFRDLLAFPIPAPHYRFTDNGQLKLKRRPLTTLATTDMDHLLINCLSVN